MHVIIKDLQDVTYMLKDLTETENDDFHLLTLARGHEREPQRSAEKKASFSAARYFLQEA